MGLLSDPQKRKKIVDCIAKYNTKLCFLCYVAGVVWFLALAYKPLNAGTYFSENALLPGLVDGEFYSEIDMSVLIDEMKAELKKDKRKVPREWIYQQLREIGLDTYIQNYTIEYPLNIAKGQKVPGQNVYGIMRARRSASTESIVLTTPLRPIESDLPSTTGGIALMIALAKFFKKQTYWSKDIIFLITDHEQIGMQAWLDGYHEINAQYIHPSDVMGRGGSIQAAINLEIPDGSVRYFDIKVEGMNGQLPNLDLVNLVFRLCHKENAHCTLHRQNDPYDQESVEGYQQTLKTMLHMMWSHASGAPTGNHGLFHKYHIEALTIQGIRRKKSSYTFGLENTGRIVEGIFRSLNNLLERFHQSFFFYILPSTSRYISIGMYMPPFGLICATAIWISLSVRDSEEPNKDSEGKEKGDNSTGSEQKESNAKDESEENKNDDETDSENSNDDKKGKKKEKTKEEMEAEEFSRALLEEQDETQTPVGVMSILPVILISLMMGVFSYVGPGIITGMAPPFRIKMEDTLFFGQLALYTASLLVPRMISRKQPGSKKLSFDWELLKSLALIFQSLILFSVALMNISLAFFLAVVLVPVTCLIKPSNKRIVKFLQWILLILVSPGVMLFISAIITNLGEKHKDTLDLLDKSWESVKHTLFLSIIDAHLFGSWMYGLFSFIILPSWLMFWSISHCHVPESV
ncbi:hypothetical protein FSP39_010424 [Pinctada imbricata]|uniref:GPI-anchor transamidase component GPAA1 n=1 Tax=Pinctada imbricata TaxID=66713 RepID=A0AA88XID2_PINIB|nr:hypothetical protein FSP39_010424 [Pinctada imbricata]